MAVWSEANLSTTRAANRIDAEFYQPDFLTNERILQERNALPLSEFLTDIRYGLNVPPDYSEHGLPFLRALNLKEHGIEGEVLNVPFSPEQVGKRNILHSGDILIVRSGANVGDCAVAFPHIEGSTFGSYVIRVRAHGIDPYYLYAFLKSKFGRLQTVRLRSGAAQPNISIPNLKCLLVAKVVDSKREAVIRERVLSSDKARRHSSDLYAEAEQLLLKELRLTDLDLSSQLFYERRYSETAAAHRLDAEYFQPAKWRVLKRLTSMKGWPLAEGFRSVRELFQPTSSGISEQVRNFDVTDALQPFLDSSKEVAAPGDFESTKKRMLPGDVVVSRLRSYLKEIALVRTDTDIPSVGSTEFIVLRSRHGGLSPHVLLVYLRSPLVQTVLKWCQDGSNHPRFDEEELLRLPIPEKLLALSQQIDPLIDNSFEARQESQRLLADAKRMVEEMILAGSA